MKTYEKSMAPKGAIGFYVVNAEIEEESCILTVGVAIGSQRRDSGLYIAQVAGVRRPNRLPLGGVQPSHVVVHPATPMIE